MIKASIGLEIAFTEIDGWDTHANQGGATGQMANRLKELADGLAAFYRHLGDTMSDVVVLTMSEFGRSCANEVRKREPVHRLQLWYGSSHESQPVREAGG